jgi:hypothetical protein
MAVPQGLCNDYAIHHKRAVIYSVHNCTKDMFYWAEGPRERERIITSENRNLEESSFKIMRQMLKYTNPNSVGCIHWNHWFLCCKVTIRTSVETNECNLNENSVSEMKKRSVHTCKDEMRVFLMIVAFRTLRNFKISSRLSNSSKFAGCVKHFTCEKNKQQSRKLPL